MATNVDASERGNTDFAREEFMLKIQASILERCLRKEVQEKQTAAERCRLLRQKISSMEDELFKAGKGIAARRCLEDSSRSEFDAIDHSDFLNWLASSSRSASSTPQQEHTELPALSKKRSHESTNSSNGFNVFSIALTNTSDQGTNRTKRVRYTSKETPPCLRCRIIKKKCDELEPCSHCPNQGYENENDFWKVLGCFRGHLRDMVDIFCPSFVRATSRQLKNPIGNIDVINFVLTKSRVSDQKRGRIRHLIHTLDDFKSLSGPTWEDVSSRESISRSAISLEQYHGDETPADIDLQEYEAAWAVLQLISMDRGYLTKTAYNLFNLIRLGNSYAKIDHRHWDIFFQAKRILRQSVELYLLERLCSSIASGSMVGPIPFDNTKATPNTLILVDLKDDIESFLHCFEKICGGRAKLTWSQQLPALFALLTFGIAKSVMIDSYVHRDSYENPSPWTANHALKISSAYKSLVSVFCWASKSDIMVGIDEEDPAGPVTHEEIRELVHFRSWGSLGFSSTKSFLLSLGTCFLPDGSFNGFLAQKVGIDSIPKMSTGTIDSRINQPGQEDRALESIRNVDSSTSGAGNHPEMVGDVARIPMQPMGICRPNLDHSIDTTNTSTSSAHSKGLDLNAQSGMYASIKFVSHGSDEDQLARRGHGGRTGALNLHTLERAREIRKLGACWNCWVMKIPCSEGSQCERCYKIASGGTKCFCNRGAFNNIFLGVLFPDFVFNKYLSGYNQDDWVASWAADSIDAQITWGYGPKIEMTLRVSQYIPRNTQNLFHSRDGQLLGGWPLPLALKDDPLKTVAETLSEKLKALIVGTSFPSYNSVHQSSELVKLVLETIQRYYEQNQENSLLQSCLLLYLSLYFSTQLTVFPSTTQSEQVRRLMTVDAQVFTSRLLNYQAKSIFYRLAKIHAESILTGLEKLLRSRNRSSWPVCFATIIMLCICLERLQMHSVTEAAFARPPGEEAALVNEPRKSCQAIEDIPYGQLTHIFHALFRTYKGDQGGLNPFILGYPDDSETPFNESSKTMIREIRENIFRRDDVRLVDHSKSLETGLSPGLFGKDNAGRLVSKFLASFVPSGKVGPENIYEAFTTIS